MVKSKKSKKGNYFLPHSKLNLLQRKFCKCLMVVRPQLKSIEKKSKSKKRTKQSNPYGLCYVSIRKNAGLHKTKKAKAIFERKLNKKKANCTMNYNYDLFTLLQVQKLAIEMNIPTTYMKNGHKKSFAKSTLIKKITSRYLDKKKKK